MKKVNANAKLKLGKRIIAKLNESDKNLVKGGLRAVSRSVCGDQCCDTDGFTNCASRVGICW